MYNCQRLTKLFSVLSFSFLFATMVTVDVSAQVPLGTSMPGKNVALKKADGSGTTLGALKGSKATLVVFWGNRCPWVGKVEDRMKSFAGSFAGSGNVIILVNSNDGDAFPPESLDKIAEAAGSLGSNMLYVSDPDGELMKAMNATRTPEYFLFDSSEALVYTGSLDDSPGDPDKVTKKYLSDAVAAVKAGNAVTLGVTKPFGCMIKSKR